MKSREQVKTKKILSPSIISFTEKNIFSDENGRDLFFLLINTDENYPGSGFVVKSSISIVDDWTFYNVKSIVELINKVINEIINEPNIEKRYFHDCVLDKSGKLCEELYDTRCRWFLGGDMINEPITQYSNDDIFDMFSHINLNSLKNDLNNTEINRREFEKYLVNDVLKNDYIETYKSTGCRFFSEVSEFGKFKSIIYDDKLLMFFRYEK